MENTKYTKRRGRYLNEYYVNYLEWYIDREEIEWTLSFHRWIIDLTQASMPIIDGKVLAKIGQNHYILRSAQRTKMIELYRKMSMN